jgi:hypothetical protein
VNLFDEFKGVVAALVAAGVPHAVCGGIAMSILAHPRATIDIDLLAPPDAIGMLGDAVLRLGFVRRERGPATLARGEVVMHRFTKIVRGDPEVLTLDVIEVQPGATAQAWATRVTGDWEGHPVTVVSREGLVVLKRLRGAPQDVADIAAPGRRGMTRAERAVLATSQARDLCLSLQRAFIGPPALERVRAGEAAALPPDHVRTALGLAWAAGDLTLVRVALASLGPERVEADPVLSAFRDVTR